MQSIDDHARWPRVRTLAGWRILLLLIAGITLLLGTQLTTSPNLNDAAQNVGIAFTLAKTGSFARAPEKGAPSMLREPLPIFALAAQIAIDPRFANVSDPVQLNEEPAIIALKQHNLAWAFVLLLGIPLLIRGFIANPLAWLLCSTIAILLTASSFLMQLSVINRNYTEIQAATLLIWSAAVAHHAVKTQKIGSFLILGALIGALALTKAAFLYMAGIYFAILFMLLLTGTPRFSLRQAIICVFAALVGVIVIVAPWSARNYVLFGTPNIAERGGIVLWIRAVKNQMNDEEWRGAFYVYGPRRISNWLGARLGFSKDDLEIDGSLRRLNRGPSSFAESDRIATRTGRPEDAVSFYSIASAERTKLQMEYKKQGYPNPSTLADKELERRAIRDILADPVSHLRTTPVFFWRSIPDSGIALIGMLAIWAMILVGLFMRRPILFSVFGLSVGMVAFHALATHAIPRYTFPALPIMMIAISILGGQALVWLRSRIRKPAETAMAG